MRVTAVCQAVSLAAYLGWLARPATPHDEHLRAARAIRDAPHGSVVILGDSVAFDLARVSGEVNAGLPGDTTAGTLWRIRHGATPQPGTPVVLVVGTVDVLHGRSELEVEAGRLAIVDALTAAGCGVLVLDEIPRGPDGVHPDLAGYGALAATAGL